MSHQHIIEVEALRTPEIGHGETRAKQGQIGGEEEETQNGEGGTVP